MQRQITIIIKSEPITPQNNEYPILTITYITPHNNEYPILTIIYINQIVNLYSSEIFMSQYHLLNVEPSLYSKLFEAR